MANVVFLDPVAYVQGKISRKHSKVIYSRMKATGAIYTSIRGERTTEPKASEIAQRTKFAVVSAAVNERMADTTKQAADKAAFKAQSKYTSVRGMLFGRAWELYDNGSVTWDD